MQTLYIFQINNLQQLVTLLMNLLRQSNKKSDHLVTLTATFRFLRVWSIYKSFGIHFWLRNKKCIRKPYAASIFEI